MRYSQRSKPSGRVTHLLASSLLLISCGKSESKKAAEFPDYEAKAAMYCAMSKPAYQERGWVVDECDGAGFTSLYALGCMANGVDLSVFQAASGEMFRDPRHDCFPMRSKSSFSKDHVLMRLAASHELQDGWRERFLAFVNKGNGFFCDAVDNSTRLSRCLISADLYSMLGGLGLDTASDDAIGEKSGFEAHLHVLKIWLKGRMNGSIDGVDLDYLATYAAREPLNAMYQAAAYRYGKASLAAVIEAFSNPQFPDDRLPDARDYCTGYLFQRDMASQTDWKPCPEMGDQYSGTDYSFATYILTR